jgi:2-polyprenyl-6-hydroxyphenyl methylase / 3-demethylubiquinone-9 3-methyltransferase
MAPVVPVRPRNDPAQYDDLAQDWWRPFSRFAGLHWLAASRAALIPPAPWPGALLLDVACGAGLLAPHVTGRLGGWRHVGLDLSLVSLRLAADHGVRPVAADALRLPFADGTFAGVVAGEVLEHVTDLETACAEIARVLAPGGVLIIDTIADSWFARLCVIRIAERLPGGPPPRIHTPDLLVDPTRLINLLSGHGLRITRLSGLRPSGLDYLRWLLHRRPQVRMLPTRYLLGVYQVVAESTGPPVPPEENPVPSARRRGA